MSQLPITDVPKDPKRSTQNAVSPFRYPGGKAFMTAYLRNKLSDLNDRSSRCLAEPFCGGAGAALNLLADGDVASVLLNDADARIYSAWYAILNEGDRFISEIRSVNLDMDEWYFHRDTVERFTGNEYSFEVGFSTFYMNRTTRSGIIMNSGPIGGFDQSGRWKIDARFNPERLSLQVKWISEKRNQISLSNNDALTFIDQIRRKRDLSNIMFFIDPPYVRAGGRLYLDGMSEAKHVALSDILVGGSIPHWILTYDDAPLIRQLYQSQKCSIISVNYSLQTKRRENEILVEPINN